MTTALDGPRLPPKSGNSPKHLVILLHGYGADGNDLIGLGREWAETLPDAGFASPNAPDRLTGSPFGGRQWFPLHTFDKNELDNGVNAAKPALEVYILAQAKAANLPLSSVALVGFSQGTMMALHVGLRLPSALACIVGFSGHLAGAERLAAEITSKPPVLLIHGESDEVVPAQAMQFAKLALQAAGVTVQSVLRPELGHSIDSVGLDTAGSFLRSSLR